MKSCQKPTFTLIAIGLLLSPAFACAMDIGDAELAPSSKRARTPSPTMTPPISPTIRPGSSAGLSDDDGAFSNAVSVLSSHSLDDQWSDVYFTPKSTHCTDLAPFNALDTMQDYESYEEFQKRLSPVSIESVSSTTPPNTPTVPYMPSRRTATLAAGVLATLTYSAQQIPTDALMRKIAIADPDMGRTGAGALGLAFTQTFLNFAEAFALPGVILGAFAAGYYEIRKIERYELENKELARKVSTQDEYIQRLTGGIKKHDIAFHQLLQSEIAVLHKIHAATLPTAKGMNKNSKCTQCSNTEKLIKEKVTMVIAKQLLALDSIHEDSEKLLADKEHHKTVWEKVKGLFALHCN